MTFQERSELAGRTQKELGRRGLSVYLRDRREKLGRALQDPEVREAAVAFGRALLNTGITLADALPNRKGEKVSWAADLAKILSRVARVKKLDVTPDVSARVAVGSEVLEAITGGPMPTHAIETALQVRADMPRFRRGVERLREILGEGLSPESQGELDRAFEALGINPSSLPNEHHR